MNAVRRDQDGLVIEGEHYRLQVQPIVNVDRGQGKIEGRTHFGELLDAISVGPS